MKLRFRRRGGRLYVSEDENHKCFVFSAYGEDGRFFLWAWYLFLKGPVESCLNSSIGSGVSYSFSGAKKQAARALQEMTEASA